MNYQKHYDLLIERARANGSYQFSDAHKAAIGKSAKGRTPWNKGIKLKT